MEPKMPQNSLLACLIILLSSCAAGPVQLTKSESAIRVYSEAPNCKYENLGIVSASSGSVGWDIEGNEEATLSMLKKNAHKVGADGVVLRSSKDGKRQWHSSGVVHTMRGDAIKGCIQK